MNAWIWWFYESYEDIENFLITVIFFFIFKYFLVILMTFSVYDFLGFQLLFESRLEIRKCFWYVIITCGKLFLMTLYFGWLNSSV